MADTTAQRGSMEKSSHPDTPVQTEHVEGKELTLTRTELSREDDIEHDGINPVGIPVHGEKMTWTWKNLVTAMFLSFLYVGSQIPLYFVGGSLQFIAKSLGGLNVSSWLPVSYALAFAALAPFCGYMQDLVGRRYVTLVGGSSLCLGIILLATAHTFAQGVIGMAFAGAGAAVGELTALAGVAELVPVKKRGVYLAVVTVCVLPFCPYLLYSQLLSTYHTWRWGIWICLMWNGMSLVGVAVLYFPKSQTRVTGEARSKLLKEIDYVGGALSITGLTLFLVAMQAGGYTHSWKSAYVLAQLIIGLLLIATFCVWEYKFAKVPMVPREMFRGQRIVGMAYFIAFVAGMNFYALLNFFPVMYEDLFNPDPAKVGVRGLFAALTTTAGATLCNAALTWFKGRNKEILVFATVIMTAFTGAVAYVNPDREMAAIFVGGVAGFGVGGVLVPAATVAVTVTPDTTIATCVALGLSIRAVGGSIGFAIYFNIFKEKLTKNLPKYIAKYAIEAGLPLKDAEEFVLTYLTAPTKLASVPGVNAAVLEGAVIGTRWAYSESLQWVWISSIPFGVCAIIACLFIGDIGKYMTNRVAAKLM